MWPQVTDSFLLSATWLHPPARWQEAVRHRRAITAGLSLKLLLRHRSVVTAKEITTQEMPSSQNHQELETGCSPRRPQYSAQHQGQLISITPAAGDPQPSSGLCGNLHIQTHACTQTSRQKTRHTQTHTLTKSSSSHHWLFIHRLSSLSHIDSERVCFAFILLEEVKDPTGIATHKLQGAKPQHSECSAGVCD